MKPKDIVTIPLSQIEKEYPDSKAFAFTIGKNTNTLYFRLGEPTFQSKGNIRSITGCLKLVEDQGLLIQSEIAIKNTTIINDLTVKEFCGRVRAGYEKVKDDKQVDLSIYESYGFNTSE